MYSLVSENLKTEGWQYFQLSGKYEDIPNHSAGYKIFCKSIESIKRKQIEQEYAGGKSADKKKKFDFNKELNDNLPRQYEIEDRPIKESVPKKLVIPEIPESSQTIKENIDQVSKNIDEQIEEVDSLVKKAVTKPKKNKNIDKEIEQIVE